MMKSAKGSDVLQGLAQLCDVDVDAIKDSYACYPIQETLMATSTELTNSFVTQMVCRLDDGVELGAWKRAWQETSLANPILRTRIAHTVHSEAVQVVVQEEIIWNSSESLESYLKKDIELPMSYGDRLWRYGIVTTAGTAPPQRFFIWTAHHAVYDGYSLTLLLRDVGDRYEKLIPPSIFSLNHLSRYLQTVYQTGNLLPEFLSAVFLQHKTLAPLPAPPFKSFISYLEKNSKTKAKEYWRRELVSSCSLQFPSTPDFGHRAVASSSLSRNIRIKWPKGSRSTLILQSAWALLLSKYTGSSQVTFPIVSSGRTAPLPGIRQMAGPCFTTVPVTFNITESQTIGEYLATGYTRYKEMLKHEHTGLSNIRRYLGEGDARVLDFRNQLVVQPGKFTDMVAGVLRVLGMHLLKEHWKNETQAYPLDTVLTYTREGFNLRLSYDPKILHQNEIHNLANQYEEIVLRLCTTHPDTPISSISALSPSDKTQIFKLNAVIPTLQNTCLHQLVTKQRWKTPEATAVSSWDGTLSYSQLDRISSILAHKLVASGVEPGALVALCFEKSCGALIAMLAVLKSGAAYVPLDPTHPKERLQEIFQIAEIKYAVTSFGHESLLRDFCNNVVTFNGETCPEINNLELIDKATPSSTAYVLFTSGSSARPKGVLVRHSAICTSIVDHGQRLGFGPSWRTLQFSAYTFDVSIAEIFTTLAFGGCVCIPSDQQRLNDLTGVIRDLKVNVALLTPTAASLLVPEEVPSLKILMLGGETATQQQVDRWRGYLKLVNAFGPTEATVYCSLNLDFSGSNTTNIGTSAGGNNWIVDPKNHESLTPIGCVGELVVSGHAIAQGYLGSPAETNAVFVAAPQWLSKAGHASTTIYKTGDLVRYKHDGTIEFIGRKDTQVKIRGLRIELGEVEHRLSTIPVAEAVMAVAPKFGLCCDKLVAVVCFNEMFQEGKATSAIELDPKFVSTDLDAQMATIIANISSKVPDYMVPSVWVVLSRAPVLISGKIDRKAIMSWVECMSSENYKICSRSFDSASGDETVEFIPGSLISDLRVAWSQVLNVAVDDIGSNTTFLSLGGDSISAIQVVTKCRKLGITITVKDILLSRTLGKLHVLASRVVPVSLSLAEVSGEPFELSPIQRMFFSQNAENPRTVRYNHGFVLRLRSDTDPEVLKTAFDAVVNKHSMLRARFVKNDSRWKQFYAEPKQSSYRIKIHSFLEDDEINSVLEAGHASINIIDGPNLSVDVFESQLGLMTFVTAHHLVVDLVSWRVILQDLEDHLNTGCISSPLGLSFSSWSQALGNRFSRDNAEAQKHLEASTIPEDNMWGISLAENTYEHLDKICWSLGTESTKLLVAQASSANRSEPVELMVSAIIVAFQRTFTEILSPSVLVESHGREPWSSRLDISETVGWFTILHPITKFPAASGGWKPLLQHTKRTRKEYPDHGLEYFSRQYLNPGKEGSQLSGDIVLNYQGIYQQLESDVSLFELVNSFKHTSVGPTTRRNALFEIDARIVSNCLEFSFTYNKLSKHQEKIHEWALKIKTTLLEICHELSTESYSPSIGDFIELNESELEKLDALLEKNIAGADVLIEDVYPCSKMQNHILKTQARDPSLFTIAWDIEISSQSGNLIAPHDLKSAWEAVVRKHPILRTIFLADSSHLDTCFIQVVLDDPNPSVVLDTEKQIYAAWIDRTLPHCLTLSTATSGAVTCHFEATHAILDGFSTRLIMSDFLSAYQGTASLSTSSATSFGSFTKSKNTIYAARIGGVIDIKHVPCIVSPLHKQSIARYPSTKGFTIIRLPPFPTTELQAICARSGITISSLLSAAWAEALSSLTSNTAVAFGTISSTRSGDVHDIVGPMIEVLPCYVEKDALCIQLLEVARGIHMNRTEKKGTIDARYGRNEERGFNTAINYQKVEISEDEERVLGDLAVKQGAFSDPWDFEIFVRIFAGEKNVDIRLEFDNNVFGEEDRNRVLACFEGVLSGFR